MGYFLLSLQQPPVLEPSNNKLTRFRDFFPFNEGACILHLCVLVYDNAGLVHAVPLCHLPVGDAVRGRNANGACAELWVYFRIAHNFD